MAGVVDREALLELELGSLGLPDTLPPPPPTVLCPARDKGPGGPLSEWVGGAVEEAEAEVEEGVPRGTELFPGRP